MSDTRDIERERRAWYRDTLSDPQRWRDKARDLLDAAACLEPRVEQAWAAHREKGQSAGRHFHDVYGPYFMLVAFALENLCKAVLVHQRRSELPDVLVKLPRFLNSHDLPDMLKQISVSVPDGYLAGVFARLKRAALWAGRYPVPTEADELLTGIHRDVVLDLYTADDVNDLRHLVAEVQRHVEKVLGPE